LSDRDTVKNNPSEPAPERGSEAASQPSSEAASVAEAAPPAVPQDAAALAEPLAKLQAENDELRETLIRRQADFENYRKRIERERHEDGQRAAARLIQTLLPVLDAFERALEAHDDPAYEEYRKGLELIYRQLWDALARQGLERIEAKGEPFDPYVHEAVERVESEELEDGTVIEVLQAGYRMRGNVLRPASVRVAVRPRARATEKTSATPKQVN